MQDFVNPAEKSGFYSKHFLLMKVSAEANGI